jgi:hypothetical protein
LVFNHFLELQSWRIKLCQKLLFSILASKVLVCLLLKIQAWSLELEAFKHGGKNFAFSHISNLQAFPKKNFFWPISKLQTLKSFFSCLT